MGALKQQEFEKGPETKVSELRQIRDLPGPRGLPLIGAGLQSTPHGWYKLWESYEPKYGPVHQFQLFHIPLVSFSDPNVILDALRRRPVDFMRDNRMDKAMRSFTGTGLFTAEGDVWRRQRKITMPAFQNANLRSFFPEMLASVRKFIAHLKAQGDADIFIKAEFKDLAREVSTQLAFGESFSEVYAKYTNESFQDLFANVLMTVNKRTLYPFPYYHYFRMPSDRRFDRQTRVVTDTLREIIAATRRKLEQKAGLPPANLLEALLLSKDEEGRSFDQQEIEAQVWNILLAGSDTTGTSLSWIVYWLMQNPKVQAEIAAEVERLLGNRDLPESFEEVQKFKVIDNVIHEALRLCPPAPILLLKANRDTQLGGVSLPEGAHISLLCRPSAWNEDNFTRAREFIPERWDDARRPKDWRHNSKYFFAFGGGSRLCPGMALAMMEITCVLAGMFRSFTLEKPANGKVPFESYELVMGCEDLWLKLKPRQRP